MTTPDDLNACAGLVERADPDRFRATMAAPVAARAVLFPIYAFNAEVARAPWVTAEAMIAEMRLQWWRDVLDEIREGGPVRRHEVATPLSNVIDAQASDDLDDLILARRWDIYRDAHADEAAFWLYLRQTSGHLMWVSARALGAPEGVRDAILLAGEAHGLANLLRAIPALEHAGRVPLVDGRSAAVKALAETGLAKLTEARSALLTLPKSARPALLPLWQTSALLARVASDPARVSEGRMDLSPLGSRVRLIWSASTGRW